MTYAFLKNAIGYEKAGLSPGLQWFPNQKTLKVKSLLYFVYVVKLLPCKCFNLFLLAVNANYLFPRLSAHVSIGGCFVKNRVEQSKPVYNGVRAQVENFLHFGGNLWVGFIDVSAKGIHIYPYRIS